MSTSITTANGIVVVTQVFPLVESGQASETLLNVTPQIQSAPLAVPLPTTKVSEMTRVFLQLQPQSLGVRTEYYCPLFSVLIPSICHWIQSSAVIL
jgi:hypothetical protein